ncbi:Sjogren's syndrome/scleroderma autoantigen 1 family protein [Halobellus sp. GM3]|uniref:Sjogren's syndrome/scleroderma autoantigen 1 family protein n=1 Tax=Halobellus sp. GM3 TaxID=3458410 RepID=UPI00403D8CA7
MSDFDEEAERKRLREKYEKDEERRKETQQMSELLLKGATMTNRHCDECGSPIFRYQGQEFCPSCQRTVGDSQPTGDSQPAATSQSSAASQPSSASGDASQASGAATPPDGRSEDQSVDVDAGGDRASDERRAVDAGGANAEGDAARPTAGANFERDAARPTGTAASASHTEGQTAAPSTRAARESLLRALTRHARFAEETDEPRRARDHLAAAREAAEALEALD